MEQAIEYAVRSGQIRNSESARVSMTGQIRKVPNGLNEMSKINQSEGESNYNNRYSHSVMKTEIIEEDEEEGGDGDNLENKTKKFCSESDMNSSKASSKFQSNDGFKQPEVCV
jgi:hypothetical protein